MRALCVTLFAFALACGEPPKKVEVVKPDPASEAAYGEAVAQLEGLVREAKSLISAHKPDAAAAAITKGEPISARVLAAPHPTLAAMEAASDLDQLYGRMLFANGNYGWARMTFQKDRSRWLHWQPQTPETERRKKSAETAMAECDRAIK